MPTEYSAGLSSQSQTTINFVEDSPRRFRRIDLNQASVADLQRLPGVNEASARRINAARKKQKFNHVHDLLVARLITQATFERIRRIVRAKGSDYPYITDLRTRPEKVLYQKPFELEVLFEDSISRVRLIRLELESVSHSLDLTREITDAERSQGRITFDLPAMEHGVMNIQVSLYDNNGNKDYLARTLPIFHNPPTVTFSPSERSLRLSNGAALMKSDGNFHCDSVFTISNGTTSTSTLSRHLNWRILNRSGGLLESGTFSFGSNIVIGPSGIVNGWFTFAFPPGNVTFNRLRAKESIRIEWRFTEIGTGSIVSDSLSWRALLGPHVNIIRVGEENFTAAERTLIFNALRSWASSIYQQQDIDIGIIRTFIISVSAAGGYVTINSNGEAEDLTSDWTVRNDAMDLFIVRSYVGGVAGLSPAPGSCDKDAKGMNGSVVELQSSQQLTGVVVAHELGHYLGLGHIGSASNLMNPTVGSGSTALLSSQGTTMKGHCFIQFLG